MTDKQYEDFNNKRRLRQQNTGGTLTDEEIKELKNIITSRVLTTLKSNPKKFSSNIITKYGIPEFKDKKIITEASQEELDNAVATLGEFIKAYQSFNCWTISYELDKWLEHNPPSIPRPKDTITLQDALDYAGIKKYGMPNGHSRTIIKKHYSPLIAYAASKAGMVAGIVKTEKTHICFVANKPGAAYRDTLCIVSLGECLKKMQDINTTTNKVLDENTLRTLTAQDVVAQL